MDAARDFDAETKNEYKLRQKTAKALQNPVFTGSKISLKKHYPARRRR